MSHIFLPDILVRVAKLPKREFEVSGETLSAALEHLCKEQKGLEKHLYHDNGIFKDHFLLTVDGELAQLDHSLDPASKVDIMLATSGGVADCSEQLSKNDIERYSRHITLPGVGRKGQHRLKASRTLIIGTGGLGSPVSLYLAAAGVGTLGLVDFDIVESSNLQRQIAHGISTLGLSKVESAKARLKDINPALNVETHNYALTTENALALICDYDVVIDGSDNFMTRYLVNDACVMLGKPLVYGAIHQFEGQASVFNHNSGPCYRCLFPKSPPPELAPNCSAGGVIGVLPGLIGMVQATEAVKLILGMGDSLSGRMLRYDALKMKFSEVRFSKRKDCAVCSETPAITELLAENAVCSTSGHSAPSFDPSVYISPKEFKELLECKDRKEAQVIDVREPGEIEICALPESIHIPLGDLEERYPELSIDSSHYVVCLGGSRAAQAVQFLQNKGFKKVYVVEGGLRRWAKEIEPSMPMY